jgi:hypothetical protein
LTFKVNFKVIRLENDNNAHNWNARCLICLFLNLLILQQLLMASHTAAPPMLETGLFMATFCGFIDGTQLLVFCF